MKKHLYWKELLITILAAGISLLGSVAQASPIELTLDEAVTLALKNNSTVKLAETDKRQMDWQLQQKLGTKKPKIAYTHTDTWYYLNHKNRLDSNNTYENEIGMTLPLYSGGQLEGGIEQAKINQKVYALGIVKSQQQIKYDTTKAYYDILNKSNLLSFRQESVVLLTTHLKNTTAQFKSGVVAMSDVLATEVNLANANQALVTAQNDYDNSLDTLKNLLGQPLEFDIKVQDTLTYTKYDLQLDDSVKRALDSNPDIAQSSLKIHYAEQGFGVAKSAYRPTISVYAANYWNSTKFPGSHDSDLYVELTTSWNIFDFGSTKAAVKEAEVAIERSKEQDKQTKDQISLNTRVYFRSMKAAEQNIVTSKLAVGKAEEDYKISGIRYAAGIGTNYEVLKSHEDLTTTKTTYYAALYSYNTYKASLDQIMGEPVMK